MRRVAVVGLLVGFILVLALLVGANAQSGTQDISGHYTVSGEGGKGTYSGTAVIHQKGDAVFVIFINEEGTGGTQGFGVIKDGYMTYGYPIREDVGCAGLYKIEKGRLVGTYAEPDGTVYTEVMTKGDPAPTRVVAMK